MQEARTIPPWNQYQLIYRWPAQTLKQMQKGVWGKNPNTHTHKLRSFKFTFKSTKQCSVSQLLVFTHASLSVTVQRLTASVEFLVPLEPNHSLAVQ